MTPITELRLNLRAAGYRPIPALGKRPPMKGWQKLTEFLSIQYAIGRKPKPPQLIPGASQLIRRALIWISWTKTARTKRKTT